jgi:hypothetical protein
VDGGLDGTRAVSVGCLDGTASGGAGACEPPHADDGLVGARAVSVGGLEGTTAGGAGACEPPQVDDGFDGARASVGCLEGTAAMVGDLDGGAAATVGCLDGTAAATVGDLDGTAVGGLEGAADGILETALDCVPFACICTCGTATMGVSIPRERGGGARGGGDAALDAVRVSPVRGGRGGSSGTLASGGDMLLRICAFDGDGSSGDGGTVGAALPGAAPQTDVSASPMRREPVEELGLIGPGVSMPSGGPGARPRDTTTDGTLVLEWDVRRLVRAEPTGGTAMGTCCSGTIMGWGSSREGGRECRNVRSECVVSAPSRSSSIASIALSMSSSSPRVPTSL